MRQKTKVARGWGIRVGGSRPYLDHIFRRTQASAMACTECNRVVKTVLVPATEYKRLIALDKGQGKK